MHNSQEALRWFVLSSWHHLTDRQYTLHRWVKNLDRFWLHNKKKKDDNPCTLIERVILKNGKKCIVRNNESRIWLRKKVNSVINLSIGCNFFLVAKSCFHFSEFCNLFVLEKDSLDVCAKGTNGTFLFMLLLQSKLSLVYTYLIDAINCMPVPRWQESETNHLRIPFSQIGQMYLHGIWNDIRRKYQEAILQLKLITPLT